MCFSATASFVAGTSLSAIGVATIRKAERPSEFPFALIPLLFGFRLLKIARKSAAAGLFGTFLWASPMVLLDLAAWTAGFWQGAREQTGA